MNTHLHNPPRPTPLAHLPFFPFLPPPRPLDRSPLGHHPRRTKRLVRHHPRHPRPRHLAPNTVQVPVTSVVSCSFRRDQAGAWVPACSRVHGPIPLTPPPNNAMPRSLCRFLSFEMRILAGRRWTADADHAANRIEPKISVSGVARMNRRMPIHRRSDSP